MRRNVSITLRSKLARPDRGQVRLLVDHCLTGESVDPGRGMGIVLAGDRLLRRLNRDYRGKDRPTDVLSFPNTGLPLPEEAAEPEASDLGEVVISLHRCRVQAGERSVDPGVELVRLLVHGILHLLGYDHQTPTERRRMLPREGRYRTWAARQGIGPGLLRFSRAGFSS